MNKLAQRGAATLVVVMVLFFIVSMVAAYTSRNLIFEQRTGANLYRATQSIEAAEAGMSWALMMLNGGRIDESCLPSLSSTDDTFRQRYIDIEPGTGLINGRTQTSGDELTPTCVFDSTTETWECSCPVDGDPTVLPPAGDEPAPAFRVRFRDPLPPSGLVPRQPGLVRIDVVGCTRLDDACLSATGTSPVNEGRTVVGGIAMLSGRATTLPLAALSARGAVGATGLTVANPSTGGSGITVHAGGTINTAGLSLTTLAGNALGGATFPSDPGLDPVALTPFSADDRFFAATFLLPPARWIQMPGIVTVPCGSTGCSASDVRDAIEDNPGRPLWLTGSLNVNSSGDLGSLTEPVIMVVNGNLAFTTAGVTIHGLVMLRPNNPSAGWDTGASTAQGRILGAVVVDGSVTGTSTLSIVYDRPLLERMRATAGTFFRVAGSWRDWPMP
jgi:hypothetical protein